MKNKIGALNALNSVCFFTILDDSRYYRAANNENEQAASIYP
jgi:hypothetical protein